MKTMNDGKITISRVTSSINEDYISIEIEISTQKIIIAKMSLKEFAMCITGRYSKCKYRTFPEKDKQS